MTRQEMIDWAHEEGDYGLITPKDKVIGLTFPDGFSGESLDDGLAKVFECVWCGKPTTRPQFHKCSLEFP